MQARKTLLHLRGTVKFHGLIQDHTGIEQASTALSYMHSWSRIQDRIRARRLHMVTEGRIRQKKLENQLKIEAKLHELEVFSYFVIKPLLLLPSTISHAIKHESFYVFFR